MEKIVYSRVFSFLDRNKIFYKQQYGFRPKYSTNHAIIDITEKIRETLDKNKIAAGVFVDFQKAFDTVNHKILIKKLKHYGIRGTLNKWFESYLDNRRQHVSVLGYLIQRINQSIMVCPKRKGGGKNERRALRTKGCK